MAITSGNMLKARQCGDNIFDLPR